MEHIILVLFHILMTDSTDVSTTIALERLWPLKSNTWYFGIALLSNESSGESVQMLRLVRAVVVRIQTDWI